MKILLFGTHHRLKRAFLEQGCQVVTCGYSADHDIHISSHQMHSIKSILKRARERINPDLLLFIDNSEPLFISEIEDVNILTAWYAIDTHLHSAWHYNCAKLFDFVFVAQKDFVVPIKAGSVKNQVIWLPLFACRHKDKKLDLKKQHEVCFIGSVDSRKNPDRVALLNELSNHIPVHIATGNYVTIFNQSKIVLNQSVKNDVNYRTFEALGCGSFLLTERVSNGQSELFADRMHLALYEKNNIAQLVELVRYYLARDDEREKVALKGMQEVLRSHTDEKRAETIVNCIHEQGPARLIERRKQKRPEIKRYAAQMYAALVFQYDFTPAYRKIYFDQAITLISRAFEQHLLQNRFPEALQDALVFSELLINNGSLKKARKILLHALSLPLEKKSRKIQQVTSDLNVRLGVANFMAGNRSTAKKAFLESHWVQSQKTDRRKVQNS